jgi:hypothetical protein
VKPDEEAVQSPTTEALQEEKKCSGAFLKTVTSLSGDERIVHQYRKTIGLWILHAYPISVDRLLRFEGRNINFRQSFIFPLDLVVTASWQ